MNVEGTAVGVEEEPRGPTRRLKKCDFPRDCRGLFPSPGEADIGPGCSHERDAGNAGMLDGKILTAVSKFLTTSPLVNKVKLLMVSDYFFYLSLWLRSNHLYSFYLRPSSLLAQFPFDVIVKSCWRAVRVVIVFPTDPRKLLYVENCHAYIGVIEKKNRGYWSHFESLFFLCNRTL